MPAVFIFNNLKVDMFQPKDAPFPGFELISWENNTTVPGTLWDIGNDAGYTPIGINNVKGQLWTTDSVSQLRELEYFLGVDSGLTEPMKIKAKIEEDLLAFIDATVYKLKCIDSSKYKIVNDGWWLLKRG